MLNPNFTILINYYDELLSNNQIKLNYLIVKFLHLSIVPNIILIDKSESDYNN